MIATAHVTLENYSWISSKWERTTKVQHFVNIQRHQNAYKHMACDSQNTK